MKKILIHTYLQRHLKKMIPIIKELKKDKNIQLTLVLMTSEEKRIAKENKINFKMLDDFTDKKRNYDFDLGWGLEPLINAIDKIKPDLFIAIEVNYILRNAVRYCKQIGIKSVIVQHGTPNKYSLHAFVPFEGDIFLAWGDFSKDFLVENGMNPDRVILTGGVPFDRTLSLHPDKNKVADELKIDCNKKWIIFTTQGTGVGNMPSEFEIKTGLQITANLIKKYEDYEIIYQIHPSQDLNEVKAIVGEVNSSCLVCKYYDTEELIKLSDGVITFFSTTAIDAVLLKKPLYLINLSDDGDFLPFAKLGVAIASYDVSNIESDFDKFIKKTFFNQEKYDIVSECMNYKNDAKALERVMFEIYNMIK